MIVTFTAGLILLSFAFASLIMVRDYLNPAVVFSGVWGLSISIIAFLPIFNYFPIEHDVLGLYILSGFIFSVVSLFTQMKIYKKIKNQKHNIFPPLNFNIKHLFIFIFILHIIIIPLWYADIMHSTGGGSIYSISYRLRQMQVLGEKVHGVFVGNYFVLGLTVIPIVVILYAQKKVSGLLSFLVISPWLVMSLISNGRASLVQMIIASFLIYKISGGKLTVRFMTVGLMIFLLIFAGGAMLTGKQELGEESTLLEVIYSTLENLADYLFQGPILFSKYYAGLISVHELWDPLTGVRVLLAKVGFPKVPSLNIPDYHYFSTSSSGNVYTIFFSIYPKMGYVGIFFYLTIYSFVTTILYSYSKKGNLYFFIIYAYLFSAMILSLFSDNFAPSLLRYSKIIFFIMIISFLFNQKQTNNKRLNNE